MKKIKYTLKFVNNGKEFEIPNWTVQKHEKAMVHAIEAAKGKELTAEEKENMLKFYIMLETLKEIDENVTIEDITDFFIHPENIVEFFNAVYYEGKQDIYFRKVEKPPRKKKDTLKKI